MTSQAATWARSCGRATSLAWSGGSSFAIFADRKVGHGPSLSAHSPA